MCYKWTHANDYFMYATRDCIAMGSGQNGQFGFYIDSNFHFGTSETSNTYLNRQLSSSEEFRCSVVEIWGFTNEKKNSETNSM